jgi:O-antigen ligase
VVVGVQMIPFPPPVWTHFGGRGTIAQGFGALGVPLPPQPVSLDPASGLNSLLGIIPPLAIICAMVRLRAYAPKWIAAALIAGTSAGIALGALQAAAANPADSPLYLYADTNWGKAVGFFANSDHMASLLVITIPFVAALVAAARNASVQRLSAIVAVAAGVGILLVVGLALNGSLAGYGLALPVIAASTLIILPSGSRLRLWIVALAAVLVVGALAALETTAIGSSNLGTHATTAVQSRKEIAATTSRAIGDFMPLGSGLGTFRGVYSLYEQPEQVTNVYVVHAHDDYMEVALELGVAGIILMALFLAWWAAAVWRAWRRTDAGPFARAAAIASAAVLIHSVVDFPLRTAAIAACFGMCVALLAESRAAPPREKAQLRRKRHVEFK